MTGNSIPESQNYENTDMLILDIKNWKHENTNTNKLGSDNALSIIWQLF